METQDEEELILITAGSYIGEKYPEDETVKISYGDSKGKIALRDDGDVILMHESKYGDNYYAFDHDCAWDTWHEEYIKHDDHVECAECEDGYHEDNTEPVYNGTEEVRFCENCRDNVSLSWDDENSRYKVKQLARYHFQRDEGYNKHYKGNPLFKFGVEVEKCEDSSDNSHDSFWKHGWSRESDSSVDEGFEMVSPIYDLSSDRIFEDIKGSPEISQDMEECVDNDCGGHMSISHGDIPSRELFKRLDAWFPVLYALYPLRIDNGYSAVKRHERHNSSGHYAISVDDNRVELRLFPGIEGVKDLRWRVNLLRIMADGIDKTWSQIHADIGNPSSRLHKLLRETYTFRGVKEVQSGYLLSCLYTTTISRAAPQRFDMLKLVGGSHFNKYASSVEETQANYIKQLT